MRPFSKRVRPTPISYIFISITRCFLYSFSVCLRGMAGDGNLFPHSCRQRYVLCTRTTAFCLFRSLLDSKKEKKKHQKKCQKQKINVNAKLDRNSFVRPTGTTTTLASEEERIKKVSFGYNECIFFLTRH